MPAHDRTYDLSAGGALPGVPCDDILESIRDEILVRRDPALILVPQSSDPWVVTRPFLADLPGLTIRGDGPGLSLLTGASNGQYPPVIFGVSRRPQGLTLDGSHWIDLHGLLDASAASAPGQRWGLRTGVDTHVTFPGGPLSYGLGFWSGVSAMTIQVCLLSPDGKPLADGPICGLGQLGGSEMGPWPWYLDYAASVGFRLSVALDDGLGRREVQVIPLAVLDWSRPIHLAIQIDLRVPTVGGWINGAQVACRLWAGGPAWPPGRRLRANRYHPFGIAAVSRDCYSRGEGPAVDRVLLGLAVDVGPIYRTAAIGDPQRRIDGKPITDYSRYFDPGEPTRIACLSLQDPPGGSCDGRLVACVAGPATGYGYTHTYGLWLHSGAQGGGQYTIDRCRLESLTVRTGVAGGYGQAVGIGACLRFEARDVEAVGGMHGVASLNMGACWPTRLELLTCSGVDAGLYLNNHIVRAAELDLGYLGRTGIRLVGCDAAIEGVWANDSATAESVIAIHGDPYAGRYRLAGVNQDSEGGAAPSVAAVTFEAHPVRRATLRIQDIALGTVGPAAAAVRCYDVGTPGLGGYQPTRVRIEQLAMDGPALAGILVDGPLCTVAPMDELDVELAPGVPLVAAIDGSAADPALPRVTLPGGQGA